MNIGAYGGEGAVCVVQGACEMPGVWVHIGMDMDIEMDMDMDMDI